MEARQEAEVNAPVARGQQEAAAQQGGGIKTRRRQHNEEAPADKRQRHRKTGAGGANGVSWQHGGWQSRQQEGGGGTGKEEEEDLWKKRVDAVSHIVTLVTRPSVRTAFLFPPKCQVCVSTRTVCFLDQTLPT